MHMVVFLCISLGMRKEPLLKKKKRVAKNLENASTGSISLAT